MKSGIYVIKNKINNKQYVGSSININNRWKKHISDLNLNKHDNSYLQKSWNKYGTNNFEFIVIEYTEINTLLEREQHYIDLFNACDRRFGYNILPKAGNILGYIHTDETRLKMSESHLGVKLSEKTRKNMSIAKKGVKLNVNRKGRKGHKPSEETRLKMSISRKGKTLSKETKEKLSKSSTGRIFSEERKLKISIALKGNQNGKGRIVTDETRKKISETHKGINKGEKNGRAMALTNKDEVLTIRNDYENGMSIKQIQIKYNRSYGIIYNIVKRITWSWLI